MELVVALLADGPAQRWPTSWLMRLPVRNRCQPRSVYRMLHVFEFRGNAISRENVWLDAGAILAQLTAA